MIAIIDYDTGNLCSVENALRRLGAETIITSDHEIIRSADRVLLPGVGQAREAMDKLKERGLDRVIPTLTQPVLGICIGMQLMCQVSHEGGAVECLGIFDGVEVCRLEGEGLKVPHMGWNRVSRLKTKLFEGITDGEYFNFVHSFAATPSDLYTIAITNHGADFASALNRVNFYGTQFHPEKSAIAGERLLSNFLKI